MSLSDKLARQLARPSGLSGRWLGRVMDLANKRPTSLAVEWLAPSDGEVILDAGCGTGAAMMRISRRADCRLIGVDLSPTMIAVARRRLQHRAECLVAPLVQVPLAPASLDAVLALNVLYFDDAEQAMLRSLRRLLREGGRLVAYVTERRTMEGWPFAQRGLHRLYDAEQLGVAFLAAGFANDRVEIKQMRFRSGIDGLLVRAWG
ncbi:class I SAM-dependent methyltransferase [Novosphingobium sp. BL-8H]|uniref:class I SAM-dependent methyltransferase n=1 Tax=Novosphingobium sp. BL-8H TaxID=3127640 RepID=UPI003757EF2E